MGGLLMDYDDDDDYDFPFPSMRPYKNNLGILMSRLDQEYGTDQVGSPHLILNELGILDRRERELYVKARLDIVTCRNRPARLSTFERIGQVGLGIGMGLASYVLMYELSQSSISSGSAALSLASGLSYTIGGITLEEKSRLRQIYMWEFEDDIKRRYFHKLVEPLYTTQLIPHGD